MNRKILLLELWGLGDLTFTTPMLKEALEAGDEVHLVGKPHAIPLLQSSFPQVRFFCYDAPWTVYKGKYRLWEWNWRALGHLIKTLRREHYDAVLSVRNDPRDHLLMLLIGAKKRIGFPYKSFGLFLNAPIERPPEKQHKVEDWQLLAKTLGLPGKAEPWLKPETHSVSFPNRGKSVICMHVGARIAVRRWSLENYESLIRHLRSRYDFYLVLIPDPDGYGRSLEPLADEIRHHLALEELAAILHQSDLLICNDSGPGHIAAALKKPTISFFGPTEPIWFRPWGDFHKIILRDYCPWRPCFDYCYFSEPYCMTQLRESLVWPEVAEHIEKLIETNHLPATLRLPPPPCPS